MARPSRSAPMHTTARASTSPTTTPTARDLHLTRTCGLDILYNGVPSGQIPAACTDVITQPLASCTSHPHDAVLFPANFGANPPARAGYPSVIVPAGRFPNLNKTAIDAGDPN